jgi:hypothetical protein
MKKYNPHSIPPPFPKENSIVYRLCPGHPGYAISDNGIVISCRQSGYWKKRKLIKTRLGYYDVCLEDRKQYRVHRLVLEAFIGPCPKGMECRHIDGKPTNNRLENLAWGTRKENIQDKLLHKTQPRGENTCNAVLTEFQVLELRKQAITQSNRSLARKYNLTSGVVTSAIKGKTWAHLPGWVSKPQGNFSLTEEIVLELRRLAATYTNRSLARKFNLSFNTVHAAVSGVTWKHLPGAIKKSPGRKRKEIERRV